MTTTTTARTTHDAEGRYLDEASAALDDLPAGERGELLSDIADAIAELEERDPTDYDLLVGRLGRPVEFAAELRRSSGAPDRAPCDATAPVEHHPSAFDRALGAVTSTLRHAGVELEPIWWLLRGAAAAVVIGLVLPFGLAAMILLVIGLTIGSIAHGVRARRRLDGDGAADPARHAVRRGAAMAGATLLLLLGVFVFGIRADPGYVEYIGPTSTEPGQVLASPLNGEIRNMYAFDAEGNRLVDVRLYDQNGVPVEVGQSTDLDPLRRRVLDAGGAESLNSFPIRYLDGEGGSVSDPDAGWPASPGPVRAGREPEPADPSVSEPAPPEAAAAPTPRATAPAR